MNVDEITLRAADAAAPHTIWGRIAAIDSGAIRVSGLNGLARIGDRIGVGGEIAGEIVSINGHEILAIPDSDMSGVAVGARATLHRARGVRPSGAWIGKMLNSHGAYFEGGAPARGDQELPLTPPPLPVSMRRGLGPRVNTGLAALDTFLPLCRGQRIGLFAGAGVGKSSLLTSLAIGVEADVVVLALIGERSREAKEFVHNVLAAAGDKRIVAIVSTCDESAAAKRRAALLAMTTAEYFRDRGEHVLLLFDSITRYADAHREIGLTAGETPSLRAYPPSTTRTLSALAERAGPGAGAAGDITAIFSVLVAGSDMDEPVADMMRGVLDGHIVLDRAIAERGRYPAIDVRRSVSRSLPGAASKEENAQLAEARSLIASYEEAAAMIQTGLYAQGSDPVIDRAIKLWPALDRFVAEDSPSCDDSYRKLNSLLS